MRRLILCAWLAGCATPKAPEVVTRPQPGLESAPTRPSHRQLPPALDVDPASLAPKTPLEFALRAPKIVKLKNGLAVYLLEDHTTPLVSLRAMLPVGHVDDPPAKVGLAWMTGMLLTEGGAGPRTPDELDALFEARAADLSSGAGEETTQVSLSLRSDDLALLLPAFADVIQRPRFDEKRFAVIVDRALESVRRREDRPDGVAARALAKAVFGPTHPLAHESTEAGLKSIALADLKKLHASTWGAASVRLVVTGDFQEAATLALLEKEFGGWKGGVAPKRVWPTVAPLQTRVIVVPRKVAQAKIRIGTGGYQRRSEREYPLRLLATSLGTFGVGRLYREIRDERGLAYSASASVSPGPTTGLFTASFDTKPEQVGEALEVALRILKEVGASQPVTPAELTTASDIAVNAFAFRFDAASKVALERATFDLFDYPTDYLAKYREQITAVTPADVTNAAASLTGLQIVIVGPADKLGDLSRFGPVTTITDVEQFK